MNQIACEGFSVTSENNKVVGCQLWRNTAISGPGKLQKKEGCNLYAKVSPEYANV
jgi:hypothetical protein